MNQRHLIRSYLIYIGYFCDWLVECYTTFTPTTMKHVFIYEASLELKSPLYHVTSTIDPMGTR